MRVVLKRDSCFTDSGDAVSLNIIAYLIGYKKNFIHKKTCESDCKFVNIDKIQINNRLKTQIIINEGIKKPVRILDYRKNTPILSSEKINSTNKDWFSYLDKE